MTRHLGFGDYRDVLRELRAIANSHDVTSADWRGWGAGMDQDDRQEAVRYMVGGRWACGDG